MFKPAFYLNKWDLMNTVYCFEFKITGVYMVERIHCKTNHLKKIKYLRYQWCTGIQIYSRDQFFDIAEKSPIPIPWRTSKGHERSLLYKWKSSSISGIYNFYNREVSYGIDPFYISGSRCSTDISEIFLGFCLTVYPHRNWTPPFVTLFAALCT